MADRKRLSKLLRKRVFAEHLAAAQIAAGPPTNAASAESDTPRPRGLSCGKRPRLTPPSPPPATRWRCCGTLFASIATASRHLSDSHGHCIDAGVTRAIAAIVADAQPTPSSATSSPINPSAGLSAKAIRLFGFVAASDGSGCGTCGCTVAVNVVPQAAASEPDIGAAAITAAAAARPARPVDRQNLTALDAAHRLVADDRAAHQPAGKGPAVADQDPSAAAGQCEPGHTHVVVLFYCYTAIARPAAMASWHRATCAELGLRGKIRVAAEGINGCVSGSEASTHRYIELVLQLPGLGDAMSPGDFKRSFAESAAFEGLQTSVVDEIITLGDATGAASSTETGQHLAPEEFHRMAASSGVDSDVLLLDCRNFYETRVGTFAGAVRPDIRKFAYFPAYCRANADMLRDKTVLMFCTGGIRCERGSSYLKSLNVSREVYQLDGGIHKYLERYPNGLYRGKLFVFDDRQSLSTNDDVLGKCFYCNDPHDVYEPCSSVGCKVLVLSCAECRGRQKSSCCDDCAFRAAGSRERCKCVRDRTRAPVQIS